MKFFGYEIRKLPPQMTSPVPNAYIDTRELLAMMGRRGGCIDTSTPFGQAQAYGSCSIVASIVAKKVSAISEARFWVQDMEGNDLASQPAEVERMMQPNPYQTLSELVCMVEFFTQVFGKAYLLRIEPQGFAGDFELYVVPNPWVTENEKVVQDDENPFAPMAHIRDYTLSLDGGATLTVTKEQMTEIGDVTYAPNRLGGAVSRLVSLEEPVNTFVASYEAANELLANRGMLGLLSLTSGDATTDNIVPMNKREKEDVMAQMRQYGILRGQMHLAVTMFNASYIPISSTITDLGLTDIQRGCKRDIAYTYQVPSILLDVEGSTFSNYGEAKMEFYVGDIIPSAKHILRALNRLYGFEGFTVNPFFDHLEMFQNAKRQQAAGLTSLVTALTTAVQTGLMDAAQAREELQKYLV